MPWDYRMVRITDPEPTGREQVQVREVWYDNAGRPVWYAPRLASPHVEVYGDDTPEERARRLRRLAREMHRARRALRRPVLDGARLASKTGSEYRDFTWRFIYAQDRGRSAYYRDSRWARFLAPLRLWRDAIPGPNAQPMGHPMPPDVARDLRYLQFEEWNLPLDQKRLESRTGRREEVEVARAGAGTGR